MAKKLTLSQIQNDKNNLNLGNGASGQELIDKSVDLTGWGRSMVMSSDGVMLAGNHALKTAKKRGEEPIYVESDGKRPVIVVRTDLKSTDDKATVLGLMDNRTNQHNLRLDMERTGEVIAELGMVAEDFKFTDDEFRIVSPPEPQPEPEPGDDDEDDEGEGALGGDVSTSVKKYQVIVICDNPGEQQKVYDLMVQQGHECRVVSLDI